MRIVHNISANGNEKFKEALDRARIAYDHEEDITGKWVRLQASEDDNNWPILEELIQRHKPLDFFSVEYTDSEIRKAEWCQLWATGQFGYPQPEDDFGYMNATYNTEHYRPTCGIGAVQRAAFRMRSEPKNKRSFFIQLNWVFDEFFVRQSVVETLKSLGVEQVEFSHPVRHRSGGTIESLWQLHIGCVLPSGIDVKELDLVTCRPDNEESGSNLRAHSGSKKKEQEPPYCGRVKYHYPKRVPLTIDRKALVGAPDIVKTNEWFGSGSSASRAVLVSQRIAHIFLDNKWRGVYLDPVRLT